MENNTATLASPAASEKPPAAASVPQPPHPYRHIFAIEYRNVTPAFEPSSP